MKDLTSFPAAVVKPLLEIKDLRKSFGATEILKGVSVDVFPGQIVGFIGASGSGKSTLLRCINRLEIPDAGDVVLDDELIGYRIVNDSRRLLSLKELSFQRRKMAMVFQQFNLWPHKTALENVIEGLITVQKISRENALKRGLSLLAKVGLAEKAGAYPSRLSGGQQQRVGIARALAIEPRIILLDEPTSALDPELVGEVLQVIRDLADEGQSMIIVTHEMGFAHEVCDHIVFLENGLIADSGAPDYIFGGAAKPRTREFIGRYLTGKRSAGNAASAAET